MALGVSTLMSCRRKAGMSGVARKMVGLPPGSGARACAMDL